MYNAIMKSRFSVSGKPEKIAPLEYGYYRNRDYVQRLDLNEVQDGDLGI